MVIDHFTSTASDIVFLLVRNHVRHGNRIAVESSSTLSRVGLVHRSDLARDGRPFHFAAERSATALALEFLPFEEFVSVVEAHESVMLQSRKGWEQLTRISSEAG